ncbi:MAG: hypothetical protein V1754_13425 [Pseudomonadota bacterium]
MRVSNFKGFLGISATTMLLGIGCGLGIFWSQPDPLPKIPPNKPKETQPSRVTDTDQLAKGPLATGKLGDFVVNNGLLTIVVKSLGGPQGGVVLDASPKGGQDALELFTPIIGTSQLQPPRNLQLHLDRKGSTLAIRVSGHDPDLPKLEVQTSYALGSTSPVVKITTTVTNRSNIPIKNFQVADLINWGSATTFAPRIGRTPQGKQKLPWIGAWSSDVSYGYVLGKKEMLCDLSHSEIIVSLAKSNLGPNQVLSVERKLIVGDGHKLGSVLSNIFAARGIHPNTLAARVLDHIGEPLPEASIEVWQQEKLVGNWPLAIVQTRTDGRIEIPLPEQGTYQFRAHAIGRASDLITEHVTSSPQPQSLTLQTGPPSQLVLEAGLTDSLDPFPCKITVFGIHPTPTPWFGPPFSEQTGNVVLSKSGKSVLPLAPGRYKVLVSHGPEYSVFANEVILPPHTGASLVAKLKKTLDTCGYVSVDLAESFSQTSKNAFFETYRELNDSTEGMKVTNIVFPPSKSILLDGRYPNLFQEYFTDWLDQLRQGQRIPALAGFSHYAVRSGEMGLARTYVAIKKRSKEPYDQTMLIEAIQRSETIISNGPFVWMKIKGRGPGNTVRLIPKSKARVEIIVAAPEWVPKGTLTLYLNGKPWANPTPVPDRVLPGEKNGLRLKKTFFVPIKKDSFLVAYVRSDPDFAPSTYSQIPPLAVTSPIWIDTNGNGFYDP